MYARGVPTQCITKEARAASRTMDAYEFDISNCPIDVSPPCFLRRIPRRYDDTNHTEERRGAVAEYYGAPRGTAKDLLLRALYRYPEPGATSFVEWISMDSNAVRRDACAAIPAMMRYFEHHGRQKSEPSVFFYSLSQKEGVFPPHQIATAFIIRRIYRGAV